MEFIDWLKDYNVIAVLITLVMTILNTIVIQLKTRKTIAEKKLIAAQKQVNEELVPADYMAYVNGRYYPMSEVSFVRKEDITLDMYLDTLRKEDSTDEKKNESSC